MWKCITSGQRNAYDLELILGSLLGIRSIINARRSCRVLQDGLSTKNLLLAVALDRRPFGWQTFCLAQEPWKAGAKFKFNLQSQYRHGVHGCLPGYREVCLHQQLASPSNSAGDYTKVHLAYEIVEHCITRPGWHSKRLLRCLAARTSRSTTKPSWVYVRIGCQDTCQHLGKNVS